MSFAVSMVNAAIVDEDQASLIYALQLPCLRLANVVDSNASSYLVKLSQARQHKMVCTCTNTVTTHTHTHALVFVTSAELS